jgi:hypothetical protein
VYGCASADGDAFAVWRCLLLPDSHKHKDEQQQTQQQLLQRLRQLHSSADAAAINNNAEAAAAAAAAGAEAAGGCVWAVFMLRGGHFAGAIVRINSSSSSSRGKARPAPQQVTAVVDPSDSTPAGQGASSSSSSRQRQEKGQVLPAYPPNSEPFTVLAHKTFHRYVVRCAKLALSSNCARTGCPCISFLFKQL